MAAKQVLDWLEKSTLEPDRLHLAYRDECEIPTHPYLGYGLAQKGAADENPRAGDDRKCAVFAPG